MMVSQDFAVPRGVFYPLWRLHTDLVLRLGGALISPGWRRAGAFLGGSIRDFYRRWPEERILQLWRECGFPDVKAKRLSLGGALIMWGTKDS
jgi:demethylmenaquinone methyltransferase/2-methoxy-6-polyprenyl-1,4-benzoquinol methylase